MDKVWRKVGLPVLVIVLGSLSYLLVSSLRLHEKGNWLVLVKMVVLFSFGVILHGSTKKKSNGWVGKLLISFIVCFYFLLQIGMLPTNAMSNALAVVGLTNSTLAIPLITILCGFLFFD